MNQSIDAVTPLILSSSRTNKQTTGGNSLRLYRLMIVWRFLLALVGGYAIAMYSAILIAEWFFEARSAAAMAATLIGFLVQVTSFIWVFLVHKTLTATLGILVPACFLWIIHAMVGA